jgi:hypothetical protein
VLQGCIHFVDIEKHFAITHLVGESAKEKVRNTSEAALRVVEQHNLPKIHLGIIRVRPFTL